MTERLATITITTKAAVYSMSMVDYTKHEGALSRRGLNQYNVALSIVNEEASIMSVLWSHIEGIDVVFEEVVQTLSLKISIMPEEKMNDPVS